MVTGCHLLLFLLRYLILLVKLPLAEIDLVVLLVLLIFLLLVLLLLPVLQVLHVLIPELVVEEVVHLVEGVVLIGLIFVLL